MSHRPSIVTTRGPTGRGADPAPERLARGLGWFSIGLGLAELFAARTIARGLGLERHETLIRAYGVREVATGAAILLSHDPTPWIYGRVGGDALDLATLATGLEDENPKRDALIGAMVAVAGVTALDIVCARALSAEQALSPEGAFDYGDRSGFPRTPGAMRGSAAGFDIPADFRIPSALRPWTEPPAKIAQG